MSRNVELRLPIDGKVKPLSEIDDYVFHKKIMGDGVAIIPDDNFIYSPVDGKIDFVFETKHAIIIRTLDGLQVLIHIGLDTVKLDGKGFATYVKVGDTVKIGDKILFFDRNYIKSQASTTIPVVITNSEIISKIDFNFEAVNVGDTLMNITIK